MDQSNNNKKCDFILASASPRRKYLLEKAGYKFQVIPSDIDESSLSAPTSKPIEYAQILAQAKAEYIARKHPGTLVVGADTIVDCDGQIIGKPRDAKHAQLITRKLFKKPHKVITALAFINISKNLKIIQSDTTILYPKKMTEKDITTHIASGTWQGKAGAYAIQETGDQFVEKLDGSLTNVMGMPMELFNKLFENIK